MQKDTTKEKFGKKTTRRRKSLGFQKSWNRAKKWDQQQNNPLNSKSETSRELERQISERLNIKSEWDLEREEVTISSYIMLKDINQKESRNGAEKQRQFGSTQSEKIYVVKRSKYQLLESMNEGNNTRKERANLRTQSKKNVRDITKKGDLMQVDIELGEKNLSSCPTVGKENEKAAEVIN